MRIIRMFVVAQMSVTLSAPGGAATSPAPRPLDLPGPLRLVGSGLLRERASSALLAQPLAGRRALHRDALDGGRVVQTRSAPAPRRFERGIELADARWLTP